MKTFRVLAVAVCALAAFPAAAQGTSQTLDFETAPPALGSPLEAAGEISFPLGQGFRPYRADVGLRAHSGTVVGDLGRCAEEVEAGGGDAGACEFFQAHTTAVLARTARSVTLFAGRFGPVGPLDPPEQATLTAFDAGGAPLASTGQVPIGTAGFNTRLSVSDDAGRIARFTVKATGGVLGENEFAGDLGIDDLSVDFAGGGAPDFLVSAPNQILALVQGQSLRVPVQIARLNGSNGPIQLSATGLPAGVSAAPVTVPGAVTEATIVLNADPSAPDTEFVPADAVLTADPLGNAAVGPGPRGAGLRIRVASDFELSVDGVRRADLGVAEPLHLEAPDCAPLDVPVKVSRDIAMSRDVALSVDGAIAGQSPASGVEAQLLPDSLIRPGGGLVAERTLRLSLATSAVPPVVSLLVRAESLPDGRSQLLPLQVTRGKPAASIVQGFARTPRFERPGTRVRVHGSGFCPGTTVEVGNDRATVPATLADPHTIEFNVPRYATTGRVTIVPPGAPYLRYRTSDVLEIDSVRNTAGFAFHNFGWDSLSLSEMVKAFGADDLFIKINPCWPFGDCSVRTGFLNPMAAIEWDVFNDLVYMPGRAHCFGMTIAAQDFLSGRERYREYAEAGSRPTNAFEMSGPEEPGDRLRSLLDAEHVRQWSGEFLSRWADRDKPLRAQLDLIEREFNHGRMVPLTLQSGTTGHDVLAYDIEQTPDAAAIYVYDSNLQFQPGEDEAPWTHQAMVDYGIVNVDKARGSWKEPLNDRWYDDVGTFWAVPDGTVPADPSLPGVGALAKGLAAFIFDSSEEAVETTDASAGAEFMPASDGGASAATGETWVSEDPGRPLEVSLRGRRAGRYTQSYIAPGFVASATDLATAEGVRDAVTGSGDSLRVRSGAARAVRIDLARQAGGSAASGASLETHASAGGADRAGLADGGALTYAHDGDPTAVEFTLSAVRRQGGPATFVSGRVPVGRGDRLRAVPLDRALSRVKLTIRDARGATRTTVLRDRGDALVGLRLGAPRVRGHRLEMRVRAGGRRARTMVGVSLRVMRGGRLLARHSVALKGVGGSRRLRWRLPRSLRDGGYRLLVDARAIAGAERGSPISDSATAHRAAAVRLGR